MNNPKRYLFFIGCVLIAWGYHLLAVPPDASYDEMLNRAKSGVLFVMCGGTTVMLWMAKR